MDRRLFFKAAGVVAAAGSPLSALLHSGPGFAADVAKPSFVGNLQRTPLRGFQGQDIGCDSALIEGRLPAALRGAFYRNGPGLFERGGQRYQHWFDGDGLVHAWRFSDHGVSHRARFVRTSKFVAESAAGEFLLPTFSGTIKKAGTGRNLPDARSITWCIVWSRRSPAAIMGKAALPTRWTRKHWKHAGPLPGLPN